MVAGHLQEKNGLYYIVLNYFTSTGKRKTKWISTKLQIKGNKKKAEELLMEARKSFVPPEEPAVSMSSSDILFVDFLQLWLKVAKSTVKLTTYASYSEITQKAIVPYFEPLHLKLRNVTAQEIQQYYLSELNRVSANSVIHYHAVIHRALKYAVKTKMIQYNPADDVDRPKKEKFMGSFYTEEELQLLFQAAIGTKIEIPVILASFYGLRRSEVIGLKWSAVDFQQNTITISHTFSVCKVDGHKVEMAFDTTKTKSSLRTLPLIPQLKELLLKKWEQQQEYKRVCGKCYNQKYLDYICVDEMGNIIKPDYLTDSFRNLLRKNGLRPIRFHDLRHTCASLLLKNGVPMKQIQEWLGHSDFSTTANIYAHLEYNSKLSSAQAMATGMSDALKLTSRQEHDPWANRKSLQA